MTSATLAEELAFKPPHPHVEAQSRDVDSVAALTLACHTYVLQADGAEKPQDVVDFTKPFQIGGRRRLLEAAVRLREETSGPGGLSAGPARQWEWCSAMTSEQREAHHGFIQATFRYAYTVSSDVFRHRGPETAGVFVVCFWCECLGVGMDEFRREKSRWLSHREALLQFVRGETESSFMKMLEKFLTSAR